MPPITTRTQPGHHRSRQSGGGVLIDDPTRLRQGLVDPRALQPNTIRTYPALWQWYAADKLRDARGALLSTDGTPVSIWPDLSGNGFHLGGGANLLGTSGRPTWRNGANGIGGIPAIQFGGNRAFKGTSRILPLAEFTLFIVMTYSSGRPIGLENDGDGSHGLGLLQSSGLWIIRNGGSTWDVSMSGASTEVVSLAVGTGGGRASTNGTITTNASAVSYSDAGVPFALGSAGNDGSQLTGKIAEFVSYAVKMSSTDQDAVVTYLRGKYGI